MTGPETDSGRVLVCSDFLMNSGSEQALHLRFAESLEAEFSDRYTALRRKSEAEYAPAQPSGELAAPAEGEGDACTLAGTAEHAGRDGADEACDDGRAGK